MGSHDSPENYLEAEKYSKEYPIWIFPGGNTRKRSKGGIFISFYRVSPEIFSGYATANNICLTF